MRYKAPFRHHLELFMRSLYVLPFMLALAACNRSGKTEPFTAVTAAPPTPAAISDNAPPAAHVAKKPHSSETVHRKQSLAGGSTLRHLVPHSSVEEAPPDN